MATQATKIIDISRTYVPLDPRAFPENYHNTGREDSPEQKKDVVAYEGYNFLPTPYGYKSYFGINNDLGIDELESRVDELFLVQTNTFQNIAVALCEDGIWIKDAGVSGAWTQAITLVVPEEGVHLDWSYCLIGKDLFCYRQGDPMYYTYKASPTFYDIGTIDNSLIVGEAVAFSALAVGLPIGTYTYRIAYFDSVGRLSLPTDPIVITNAAVGNNTITCNRIAGATGYRIYWIVGGTVNYVDVPQVALPITTISFAHATTTDEFLVGSLPDLYTATQYDAYEFFGVTPNFINMAGQIGIFRAGSRLAFWDSEDSISYSSIDDFADFVPSITTLAGSAIFQVVNGRIVNILSSGDGFVIYATKSIVMIARDLNSQFQYNPLVLVSGAGIAFKKECCAAVTDTMQFAYTSVGLYKIEGTNAEVIIPEVTDYLRESSAPIYPKILEGRYLFLQILDPNYIDGLVSFATNEVPASAIVFPGAESSTDDIGDVSLTGNSLCTVLGQVDSGLYGDMQADAAAAAAGYEQIKLRTFYKPIWRCFLSRDYGGSITYDASPCGPTNLFGGFLNMSPEPARFTATRPDLVQFDGMTIESFIAVQEAIWDIENGLREEYIAEVTSRVQSASRETRTFSNNNPPLGVECTPSPQSIALCDIGSILTGFSGGFFTISRCNFALTRVSSTLLDLINVTKDSTECGEIESGWYNIQAYPAGTVSSPINAPFLFESPQACIAAVNAIQGFNVYVLIGVIQTVGGSIFQTAQSTVDPINTTSVGYVHRRTSTRRISSFNKAIARPAIEVVDSPYCEIYQWEYEDVMGNTVRIPAASCVKPPYTENPPNSVNGAAAPKPLDKDGSICGIPFDPITIPGIQDDPIEWPDQTVIIPQGSFLLQAGSIGPVYPDFFGALVYDLQLKKWGKMKNTYKQLLDYSPINSLSGNNIPYETFGMQGGIINGAGTIFLFDENPIDSYIKYGKIGYYRQGFTSLEEIRASFRTPSTCTIETEGSLNGSTVETTFTSIASYVEETEAIAYPHISARWHNVTFRGNYDLKHFEFRGTTVSNR